MTRLPKDDSADPEIVLEDIVRAHIGRPPRYTGWEPKRKIQIGLRALRTELHNRKPAQFLGVWIEAQVGCMKDRLARDGLVHAGWLFGPDAERRYRAHVRYLNDHFIDETPRVRQDYARRIDAVSFELAELLRVCWLDGRAADMCAGWTGITASAARVLQNPTTRFGYACALRAACDFLHQICPGVQHRIAAPVRWNWTAFLDFVCTHFPATESANPVLRDGASDVSGLYRPIR